MGSSYRDVSGGHSSPSDGLVPASAQTAGCSAVAASRTGNRKRVTVAPSRGGRSADERPTVAGGSGHVSQEEAAVAVSKTACEDARVGKRVVLLAGIIGVLAAGFLVALTRDGQTEEFCNASARIVTTDPMQVGEWTLYVDEPAGARDPCQGDDLWHYQDEDLAVVDGVLFDDCVLSWVDGGRTTAAEEGIKCTPKD